MKLIEYKVTKYTEYSLLEFSILHEENLDIYVKYDDAVIHEMRTVHLKDKKIKYKLFSTIKNNVFNSYCAEPFSHL